ncbi:MAG: hypothetical protein ABIK65_16545 [Candidatus Eisenbacteria bacterium]
MYRNSLPFLLLSLAAAVAASWAGTGPEFQYTYLAGSLPDTLHQDDSPFMALDDLYAYDTVVEPGVEILFTANTKLDLSSATNFYCLGTEASPVLLHDAGLGPWGGVYLSPSVNGQSIHIAHMTIQAATTGLEILNQYGRTSSIALDTVAIVGCADNGLYLHGNSSIDSITVVGLEVSGATSGIYVVEGGTVPSTFRDCYVHNNTIGVFVNHTYEVVSFIECTVEQNEHGFQPYSPIAVNYSYIRDNSEFDVWVGCSVTQAPSLNFQYCYWSLSTTQEMIDEGLFSDISTIYDWWDDHAKSIVDYSGFDGGPTGVQVGRFEPTSWSALKRSFK